MFFQPFILKIKYALVPFRKHKQHYRLPICAVPTSKENLIYDKENLVIAMH